MSLWVFIKMKNKLLIEFWTFIGQLPPTAFLCSHLKHCSLYVLSQLHDSVLSLSLSHSLCIFVSRLFFRVLAFRIPCPPAFLLVLSTYCLYVSLLYCLTSLLASSLVLTLEQQQPLLIASSQQQPLQQHLLPNAAQDTVTYPVR